MPEILVFVHKILSITVHNGNIVAIAFIRTAVTTCKKPSRSISIFLKCEKSNYDINKYISWMVVVPAFNPSIQEVDTGRVQSQLGLQSSETARAIQWNLS